MSIEALGRKITGTITSARSWVDDQADKYIIKPQYARGISGFEFSTKDDDRLELRAEVTDYVTEEGATVQDHIVLKPTVITLRGFVGEVRETVARTGVAGFLGALQRKLSLVSAYLPIFPTAYSIAQQAIDTSTEAVEQIDIAIKRTENLVGILTNPFGAPFDVYQFADTAQGQAYYQLWGLFQGRQVITVETPWVYLDNMVITSVIFEQDGKTNEVTDVAVTLKQMKFVDIPQEKPNENDRRAQQMSKTWGKGRVSGSDITDAATAPWSGLTDPAQRIGLNYILDPELNSKLPTLW